MAQTYDVTGTLTDERTVRLDDPLPLKNGRVRVLLEPVDLSSRRRYLDVMGDIRARQRARGHAPSRKDEIDAHLQVERDSWDN